MGSVIRMADRAAVRRVSNGRTQPVRSGEQRFRYPGPDAISEVSSTPAPRRERRPSEERRESRAV